MAEMKTERVGGGDVHLVVVPSEKTSGGEMVHRPRGHDGEGSSSTGLAQSGHLALVGRRSRSTADGDQSSPSAWMRDAQ